MSLWCDSRLAATVVSLLLTSGEGRRSRPAQLWAQTQELRIERGKFLPGVSPIPAMALGVGLLERKEGVSPLSEQFLLRGVRTSKLTWVKKCLSPDPQTREFSTALQCDHSHVDVCVYLDMYLCVNIIIYLYICAYVWSNWLPLAIFPLSFWFLFEIFQYLTLCFTFTTFCLQTNNIRLHFLLLYQPTTSATNAEK